MVLKLEIINHLYKRLTRLLLVEYGGGIHYMPAITLGVEQGNKVGEYVLSNLNLMNETLSKN